MCTSGHRYFLRTNNNGIIYIMKQLKRTVWFLWWKYKRLKVNLGNVKNRFSNLKCFLLPIKIKMLLFNIDIQLKLKRSVSNHICLNLDISRSFIRTSILRVLNFASCMLKCLLIILKVNNIDRSTWKGEISVQTVGLIETGDVVFCV